jgi:colanic acid/amylovoran biosynthesis glycosyltransferase
MPGAAQPATAAPALAAAAHDSVPAPLSPGAPRKLGYLISQYPALNHTFILREVRSLRSSGFEVHTVSVRRPDRALTQLSAEEADEHRRTFSILGAGIRHALRAHAAVLWRHPWRYLRGLLLAWSLSRGTPRLLVTHTFYFLEAVVAGEYFARHGVAFVHTHFSSTVLLILGRVFPIDYSMTVHGSGEFDDVVGFHMAEKVAGARFIATISHYGSSQVMRACDPMHWHKVLVLPLGIDVEAFAPRPARLRAAGEPFRLVFVGRLASAKAPHMLIEALAILHSAGRNVVLTIVGDGPTRASLEQTIGAAGLSAAVHLAGACNHDRVADFLAQSDAFVLTSFAEGVPVVLMEAMAMELPCVSTWITGIPELIDNGKEGLLVPPASPQDIARAVACLMDDPAMALRLGKEGRRKITGSYDLTRNVRRLGAVFAEQMGAAAASRAPPAL